MSFPDYKCSLLKPIYLIITYFRVSLNSRAPFFKVIKFCESIYVFFFYHNGIGTQQATGNSNETDWGDRRFWKEWSSITKKLKQLITENYREQDADGKFEDCTEEVLQELIQQDESDDEE